MKKIIPSFASCMTIVLLSAFSFSSAAAVDMFLKIAGIDGDSQDALRSKNIDILAWSWGTSSVVKSKGRVSCNIQDVSITKYVDSSSPAWLMGQLAGTEYVTGQLAVRKAGSVGPGSQIEYIVIDFNNVRITSLSTGGSGGEDRLTENVSFSFTDATYTYTPQTESGAGTPISATIGGC